MPQPRKYLNGAYKTHNVNININSTDEMGHKPMIDMHPNTLSKDSPIKNDVSSGVAKLSDTAVLRDVHDNYFGPDHGTKMNVVVRKGKGKHVNVPIYGSHK